MRALVTGGAGFLGSSLVRFLLEREWSVDIIDDFSTGSMVNLPSSPRLSIINSTDHPIGSAELQPQIDSWTKRADAVFHLAAVVGVHRVLELPLRTIEQNILATATILRTSARYGVPTVIASSSEVYGRSIMPLLSEEQDIRISPNIRWGYAAAKAIDEFTALAHYNATGLPVVVCRLFNTIGPRQSGRYGMVVPRFIVQATAGAPITVYGDGQQRRAFTWVGDVVSAMAELVRTPAAYGQIVNIGHTASTSITDLAKLVRKLTGSSSDIRYVPVAEAYGVDFEDIEHRAPSLDKIRSLIHYRPALEIDDMIVQILQSHAAQETR